MDRRLAAKNNQKRRRIYGRSKPGYLLKHHIPIKTDSWDVASPGFTEVDLVSHSGNSGQGEFGYSLNITDIETTWTETRTVPRIAEWIAGGGTSSLELITYFELEYSALAASRIGRSGSASLQSLRNSS
jgi:hypothetical protein